MSPLFNRYIPGADGIYHRQTVVPDPPPPPRPSSPEVPDPAPPRPRPLSAPQPVLSDPGDLLVLLILLLIFWDSDGNGLTALVALAAFILLQ